MLAIFEPILAGLCVSLFNKFILNNNYISMSWCMTETVTVDNEDTVSSSNTTISDMSFDTHVHCHQ